MKKFLKSFFIIIFWILIWQLIYLIVNKDIIIPAPEDVMKEIINSLGKKEFYISIISTFRNIIIGFTLSYALGIIVGIFNLLFPFTKELIIPIINIIRVTPIASFIIIALVFMETKNLPILVSFFMVFPLVWRNIIEAFNSVDEKLIEMSNLFKVGKISQIKNIYLPQSISHLIAAIYMGFGYAWKSVITAEVMSSATNTIGSNILDAKIYLNTTELFSWTIVVIILSILTEKIILFFSNIYIKKNNILEGDKSDSM